MGGEQKWYKWTGMVCGWRKKWWERCEGTWRQCRRRVWYLIRFKGHRQAFFEKHCESLRFLVLIMGFILPLCRFFRILLPFCHHVWKCCQIWSTVGESICPACTKCIYFNRRHPPWASSWKSVWMVVKRRLMKTCTSRRWNGAEARSKICSCFWETRMFLKHHVIHHDLGYYSGGKLSCS